MTASARNLAIEELVRVFIKSSRDEASPYCAEIIRRFEPLLRRAWYAILSGRVEYEDFVQEVFLRLFGKIRELRNLKTFPGYFRRTVYSVAVDLLRHGAASKRDMLQPLDAERLISRLDEAILAGVFVRSYLEQLPPGEREVLELEYVYALSPEEIMQATGLTRGGISAAKSRGMSRLRAIFKREAKALEKSSKRHEEKPPQETS